MGLILRGISDQILQRKFNAMSEVLIRTFVPNGQIHIVEGKMQYLYDHTGRRYLDGFAGIVTVSVGHCHPKFIAAVQRQTAQLQHTTSIYLNHNVADFAEALVDKLPGDLKVR